MFSLTEFLEANWLALALLVTAAGFAVRVGLRLSAGRGFPPVSTAVVYACGLLGLGGLVLGGGRLDLFGWETTPATLTLAVAGFAFFVTLTVLVIGRVWSFWVGLGFGAVALLGLGGALVPWVTGGVNEAVRALRGLEFVRPEWLFLLLLVPFVFLISRRSLSGLGPTRKWTAITLRALGIALLAMALAEPRVRKQSEHVTVLYVVDRSFSIPQDPDPTRPPDEPLDLRWERVRGFIEQSVASRGADRRNDQVGLILFGKRPKLALPPAAVDRMPVDERMAGPIDGNYTDIAAAIKLALASFPEGTGKRIVLISDGNENIGNAEEQANLARENRVEIDTIALAPGYRNESEVLVQAVEAPPVTALGQRLPVRVLIRNATRDREVVGRLEVFKGTSARPAPIEIEFNPQVIDPEYPPKILLRPGLNVFRFRDRLDADSESSFAYRAVFTPTESRPVDGGAAVAGLPGDRTTNNRAAAAVVSRGHRKVLFLDDSRNVTASPHRHLIEVLRFRGNLNVQWFPAEQLPADKTELGLFLSNYDCVVIANVPYERFSSDQAEMIRAAVYDQGCGLVMIGGPDAYGAGGYQGTAIEAALPVDCEIKAMKAAGKGGLVLVMHASEMAEGNKWQKDIAKLAIQRLGPEDMVGVCQYGFGGNGVNWHIPFQRVGEAESETRRRILARVDSMMPGDMPDFDPFLRAAADTLINQKDLTVRHTIVISDGDPQYGPAGKQAIADMAANNATCTTVGVATHGVNEDAKMKSIAEGTKDGSGKPGTFYKVADPRMLPAIYIKESRRVSQSFIYDKPFTPQTVAGGGTTDVLAPGLPNPLPPLHGFVRTTLKENVLAGMSIEGPQVYDQRFPILASWRYGLGKAVAFTSDARTRPSSETKFWDREWVASDVYQKFWEQVVNWAMREAERGRLTLVTEYRDGRVRVTADARDDKDKPVGGLTLRGAVTTPNEPAPGEKRPEVEFKPKGGGIYEAEFPAEEAGSYFVNVQALEADGAGKLQPFDAARAGVTVPYSPEYADLESNTPFMRRLAELTGGKFHTEADEELREVIRSGELFRDAPSTTRALLPFWFWLVFAAAVLLLLDVAVRRIAIELGEVTTAGRRFWAGLRHQPVAEEDSAALGRLLRRKAAVGEQIDRGRSTRRFEATPTSPTEPAPLGADDYVSSAPSAPPPGAPPVARRADQPAEEEDTFAKLRKAKQRARHKQKPGEEDDQGR